MSSNPKHIQQKEVWLEIITEKWGITEKKSILILKESILWEIIEILFDNKNHENTKVRDYFKSRIIKLINWDLWEVLRNNETSEEKWIVRRSDTHLLKNLNSWAVNNLNHEWENERVKLERYYSMYNKYFVQRFKDEIIKSGSELSEDDIEKIIKNKITKTFSDIIYIYGYTLSPDKVWELILNPHKLSQRYKLARDEFDQYKDFPKLVEILRHINEREETKNINKANEIENHFVSSFWSLADIFNQWFYSPTLDKNSLEEIISRIKERQKYIFLLCKNKDAFKNIESFNNDPKFLIIFFDHYINENISKILTTPNKIHLFKRLFVSWGKYTEEQKSKFIKDIEKEKKNEISIPEKLVNLNDKKPENLTFEDLKNSWSTDRLIFLIFNILNIWNKEWIKLPNITDEDNIHKLEQFVVFYNDKYFEHNLENKDIRNLLIKALGSIKRIKNEDVEMQKKEFLDFVENNNEEFQILISWWRYDIMYKSFWWINSKIIDNDSYQYWTKELFISKLKDYNFNTDIISSDILNWSAWSLDKILELDNKSFTHWEIEIDNHEKFWLWEELWLIWNHTKLYTLDKADYDNNSIIIELKDSYILSENITNNLFKTYIGNLIIHLVNNYNEKDKDKNIQLYIKKVLDNIEDEWLRWKIKSMLFKCANFVSRNYEKIKISISKKELIERMNICNLILWDEYYWDSQDNSFLIYLEKIWIIKSTNKKINYVDYDKLWKIRRFIKYIIKISDNLSEMIEKSEEDRIIIERLLKKWKVKSSLNDVKITLWPRKEFWRMLMKFVQKYNWDLRKLHDLSRLRITYNCDVIESMDVLAKFTNIISTIPWITVTWLNISDNTWNPYEMAKKATSFRDIQLWIRLPSKNVIEAQAISNDIEIYKSWISSKILLDILKKWNIKITQDEYYKIIENAKKYKIKLPVELLQLLDFEISKENIDKTIFYENIKVSSDSFYNLWRWQEDDVDYVKKIQLMEALPNKVFWWKHIRRTIENLFNKTNI